MEILKGRDAQTHESDRVPLVFDKFIMLCVFVHILSYSEGNMVRKETRANIAKLAS